MSLESHGTVSAAMSPLNFPMICEYYEELER